MAQRNALNLLLNQVNWFQNATRTASAYSGGGDVSRWAGKPVRLRFELRWRVPRAELLPRSDRTVRLADRSECPRVGGMHDIADTESSASQRQIRGGDKGDSGDGQENNSSYDTHGDEEEAENGRSGETYCLGGDGEMTNLALVKKILELSLS